MRVGTGSATFALLAFALVLQQVVGGAPVLAPGTPGGPQARAPAAGPNPVDARDMRDAPAIVRPCSCDALSDPLRPGRDRPDPGVVPKPRNPSGYQLAFASNRDGDFNIYTMHADGSGVRRLTNHPADERRPEWSPDGTRIAFVRLDDGTKFHGDIYVMDADGSNVRHLTSGGGPQWSPDGTRIAFHDVPDSGATWTGVFVIDADGTNRRLIATRAGDPAWTHDGRGIVFGGLFEGVVNVYVISLDDGRTRRISNDSVYACDPDVSPDGRLIAYTASAPTRIEVVRFDGSGMRRLTDSSEWEFSPSWSPDGTLIAFARDPDTDLHFPVGLAEVGTGAEPGSIVIITADGSLEVTLPGGPYSDVDPAFSPRGP